jgi:hypothetical protein
MSILIAAAQYGKTMTTAEEVGRERERLNFAKLVEAKFAFLMDLGFSETASEPTIVRFQKDDLAVSVYHGRQSYEIGIDITQGGERYSISELIRSADPATAEQYRNPKAMTSVDVAAGLDRVAGLLQRYGARALHDDPDYFAELRQQRKAWSESYALDVLRPKAEAAFREGRYADAVSLYEQIAPTLSASEQKKLRPLESGCSRSTSGARIDRTP